MQLSFIAFRWIVCLLVREFDVPSTMLLWDAYFALGACFPRFHLFVCAVLISQCGPEIEDLQMYDVVNYMQAGPFRKYTPQDMRAVIGKAIALSQRFPFPDDPSRERALRVLPGRLARYMPRRPAEPDTAAAALARNLRAAAGAKARLVRALAATMRSAVAKAGSTADPAAVLQAAKRAAARVVVLAVVCAVATSAVMAIRWISAHDDDAML